MPVTPPRLCVYCGSPADTEEHAWPKWLQKYGNQNNQDALAQMPSGLVFTTRTWDFARAAPLCGPCNEWSGIRFEHKAAPLVKALDQGITRGITPRQQRLLASWAYKTALMLEALKTTGTRVEAAEYRRFRSAAEPPAACSMVMGISEESALAFNRYVHVVQMDTQGRPTRWVTSIFLVAAHLFFHAIVDGGMSRAHERMFPQELGLQAIWPPMNKSLLWPLRRYFSRQALTDFARFCGDPNFEFLPTPDAGGLVTA